MLIDTGSQCATRPFQRRFSDVLSEKPVSRNWLPLRRNITENIQFLSQPGTSVQGRWQVLRSGSLSPFGWNGRFLEVFVDTEAKPAWKVLSLKEQMEPFDQLHTIMMCRASKDINIRMELAGRTAEQKKISLASRDFVVRTQDTPIFLHATNALERIRDEGPIHSYWLNISLKSHPKFGLKIFDLRTKVH